MSFFKKKKNVIRDSNFCKAYCDMSIWYILQLTKEESVLFIHLFSLFHSGRFSTEKASAMVRNCRNNVANALLDANVGEE